MRSTAIRCALVALALPIVAWLALGLHALDLQADARAVVEQAQDGQASREEVRRARQDLRDARRFSEDVGPLLDEGDLLAAAGRPDEAAAIAKRATDAEPENLRGWILRDLLVVYVRPPDLDEGRAIRRRIAQLNPLAPDSLPPVGAKPRS